MDFSNHNYLFLSKGRHPQVYGYVLSGSYGGCSIGCVVPGTQLLTPWLFSLCDISRYTVVIGFISRVIILLTLLF